MKSIKRIFVVTLFLFSLSSFLSIGYAQNSQREYLGFKQNIGEILIQVNDGVIKITPYSKKIFHVAFITKDFQVKSFAYAADLKPGKVDFLIKDEPNELRIESTGIKIIVSKKPFNISYYQHSQFLFSEKDGYSRNDSMQLMGLSLDSDEILYGGGERVLGMNRRGNKLTLFNKANYGYETRSELMNYSIPMYLSSKLYAVLFDNPSTGILDLDSNLNNKVEFQTKGGTINYFIVTGNDWYELIDNYTLLTGRQPLPARWTLGNYSSRFGYHSQNEVMQTVNKFFADSIPVEAVIVDIYWFGKEIKGTMGNLDWYKDSFPDPVKMIADLKKRGVKTVLVTEPFILTTSSRWEEAKNNKVLATDLKGNPYTYDFYFGNTGLIDIFKPEARTWFWNIYKDLTIQGIGGWWGDLGEPEVHPSALQHVNGSADEVHNAYGHEWAKLIYDGYRKDFPTVRPFVLMRSGFAGSQRYGMIPWTGDVSRSWGGLFSQQELSLQMGMQGLAYTHSDLGGFADGVTIDDELYIRWLQYGVFQPIYRPHAQEHIPSEPVFQKESTKLAAKKAIELRYMLIPYIYDMAFKNSQTGKPLMIPLFFNHPEEKKLLTYEQAYMFGDALLVAPVKSPGLKQMEVYLPKGSQWIDFNTHKALSGGQQIIVPTSDSYIPVFVKGGAFIPMQPKVQQTNKYNLEAFELHYYFDNTTPKSRYELYNDDGETFDNFGKGKYEFIKAETNNVDRTINLKIWKEQGRNLTQAKDNTLTLVIHNLDKKPKKIEVNGEKLKSADFTYDETSKSASFNMLLRKNEKLITIAF